jgi:Flp pilus assembly protein TadD
MDLSSITEKMFSALNSQQSSIREGVATTMLSSGITLMQKKKYKEAAAAFRQVTALKPDSIDAYNYMADANLRLGKRDEAVKAYNISLKLDPKQDQVHINLANIYIEDKKNADAQQQLKLAIRDNPASTVAHYTLGHLLLQMDQPKEAESEFRTTIRLAPRDGNALYGLGTALNKLGRSSEAVDVLQQSLQYKRDSAATMFELGKAYLALDQKDAVQGQITALNKSADAQGAVFAEDLATMLRQPKIIGVDQTKSNFNPDLGTISILALDPSLITPSSTKEFSMTFTFDTEMDATSVTNLANWSIARSKGGTAGLYDNGLYRPTDRAQAPIFATRVTYNPVEKSATVYFPISQNSDGTGTIDPSHLTFKFQGKDASGKVMDPTADEFNGFAGTSF